MTVIKHKCEKCNECKDEENALNATVYTIIFIVLLVLKLTHQLDWNYWMVTMPLWFVGINIFNMIARGK